MMNRIFFILIFMAIGFLVAGWWHNRSLIEIQQSARLSSFINAGPRFTAKDGQALCERIAMLEKYSIGFQQSGIVSPPCNFYIESQSK